MRCLLFASVLCGLFTRCDVSKTISSEELKAFILDPDNGLKKTVEGTGNIKLEMLYRPKDLVLEQETIDGIENLQEIEKRVDSLDYFVLYISRNHQEIENSHAGDPAKFNAAVQYLSEGIKGDISLLVARSFIAEGSHYIPNFGASGSTTVLLVFKSYLAKQDGKLSIIFEDSFFGSGRSEFRFDTDDIKNIPRLKF